MLRRRGALARPARAAGRPGRRRRCAARSAPAPRPCSCSTPGPARWRRPTTSATCCPTAGGCSRGSGRPRRAPHPLRRRHRRAARPDGRGPAPTSSASTGGPRSTWPAGASCRRRRAGRRRAGQPRPGRLPVPVGRRRGEGAARCSPATAATPATSSTSATACCPRPTPAILEQVVERRPRGTATVSPVDEWQHRRCVLMAYGTPARPTTSRPTTPTSAVAARRRPSSWPTSSAATRPSAASRRSPSAPRRSGRRSRRALDARGPGPVRRRARAEARRADASRTASPRSPAGGVERRRRPGAGPALLGRVGRPVPRAGRRGGRRGRASPFARRRALAPRAGLPRLPGRRGRGRLADCRPARRSSSPPTRLPERDPGQGDPYPEQLRETAAAVADRGRAGAVDRLGRRLAVGRTDAGAVARARRAHGHRRAGRRRRGDGVLVCACGFVADHLEVLYDLDIEARARAAEAGLAFARTACVNDDPAVHGGAGRPGHRRRPDDLTRWPRPRTSSSSAAASPGWPPPTSSRRRPSQPVVTVLEAGDRLGGKILHDAVRRAARRRCRRRHRSWPGRRRRSSWPAASASPTSWWRPAIGPALVWSRRQLHPIPPGLVLGVPTGLAGPGPLPACCRGGGRPGPRSSRSLPRRPTTDDDLGLTVRAPLRRRGARPPGRPAGRRHQRRRPRPT